MKFDSSGPERQLMLLLKETVSWDQQFFDPIMLGRKPLVTLRDAAHYITKLPKAEHEAAEWQAAMQALKRHVERVFDPSRKDKHWGRRKLARDR